MKSFLCSTVGKKAILSVTGLLWAGFVLTHMAGNLLILVSPEVYNTYSHKLITNPAIFLAEGILLFALIIHVSMAITLTRRNRLARTDKYAISPNGDKNVEIASKTMIFHGMLLLAFTIMHLITFKYGSYYEVTYDGVVMRDLHRLIVETFSDPIYFGGYCFAMVILGLHLYHGVSSVFQSWGFNHPQYTPKLKCFGKLYATVVAAGFLVNPIYVYSKIFFEGLN